MTNTNKLEEKSSTALKFAYSSLVVFFMGFVGCMIWQLAGGLAMLASGVLGLIAIVLGIVEKNSKAWGLGLIPPALFVFFVFVGLAMRS